MKRNDTATPIKISRVRLGVAACCFLVATLLAVHAGLSQPDLPFDFTLPQPPVEKRAASAGDADALPLLGAGDASEKVLERSRELSDQASARSERPPRERSVEIPELPPEVAAMLPAIPQPEMEPADEVEV